jgi:hypothetical protein
MTTTAQYRKLAFECEKARDYVQAAIYWQIAYDQYPATSGELAEKDRESLRMRARSCRAQAVSGLLND